MKVVIKSDGDTKSISMENLEDKVSIGFTIGKIEHNVIVDFKELQRAIKAIKEQ